MEGQMFSTFKIDVMTSSKPGSWSKKPVEAVLVIEIIWIMNRWVDKIR
jgi:hypothetical protein